MGGVDFRCLAVLERLCLYYWTGREGVEAWVWLDFIFEKNDNFNGSYILILLSYIIGVLRKI